MSRNFDLLLHAERHSGAVQPQTSPHTPRYRATRDAGRVGIPPAEDNSNWRRAWVIFRTHWRLSALFAAAVIAPVLFFTALAQPVYEPTARLEIAPPGAELFRLEGRAGGGTDPEYAETQAREMESDDLAIAVIRKLDLAHNSQFMSKGISPLSSLSSLLTSRRSKHHHTNNPGAVTLTADESDALQRFKHDLTVRRDTASRLVTISFASPDPALSALVTNTLLELFVEQSYETRHQAIMHSTEWLSRQLDDIRTKMEQSNRALAEFQRANSIIDVDHDRSTVGDQVAELSRQKTQAVGERIQLEAYLRNVRSGNLNALPQIQSNPVIQELAQKLVETRSELSQARAVLGDNHPTLKKLQNGADELQAQLQLQREAVLAQLQISYAAALSREHMIGAEMQGAAKQLNQLAEYITLKREAQTNTELYTTLYARVKETGIAAASNSSNVRIVDKARMLDTPTAPKVLVNLGFGFLVALAGATMLPFIRERIDGRLHDADDVRRWTGLCSVSLLPLAAAAPRPSGWHHLLITGNGKTGVNCAPAKFLLQQPDSAQAEALRGVETAVMLSAPSRPPQVLLVASSVPGEGKTTVAINLAIALARQGRTCIIDADLRRSMIASTFNLHVTTGLAEHLAGSVAFNHILFAAADVANLAIMPAGTRVEDPGTLVRSSRMGELLQSLRQYYDYVVIDSPPLLLYADGRALAPLVDGIVFIARAGEVTRDAVVRSMELLNQVHSAPILQVVVNGADELAQSYASALYCDQAEKHEPDGGRPHA